VVKPGRILFELSGVREDVAAEAMRKAGHKLPIPTRFVKRIAEGSAVPEPEPEPEDEEE
jgi:large subunit ribosomal protein L16